MNVLALKLVRESGQLKFKYTLVDVIKETECSFRVVPHQATEGKTFLKKDEVDKVNVVIKNGSVSAFVWAINDSDTLHPEFLRYWKQRICEESIEALRSVSDRIKSEYNEISKVQ